MLQPSLRRLEFPSDERKEEESIWMECGKLLRVVSGMNLILIYLIYSVFKVENPTYVISSQKTNKQTKNK